MSNNPRKRRKEPIPDDVIRYVDRSMRIVKQINLILKRQDKNHAYLAEILGKSQSEICKWMSGTHNFTMKTICKIEEKLGEPIIKCVEEEQVTISNMVAEYSTTANRNIDIINQIPTAKAEFVSKDPKGMKIAFIPVSIQENEMLVMSSYGNYN